MNITINGDKVFDHNMANAQGSNEQSNKAILGHVPPHHEMVEKYYELFLNYFGRLFKDLIMMFQIN